MRYQYGQSMTEFIILLPVLLMLILGILQYIFIYQAKNTLNYATFEATRAGSLENAQLDAVLNGYTRGMAPLFTRPTGSTNKDRAEALIKGRDKAREEVDNYTKIERINPTPEAFKDFGIDTGNGVLEIPNNHLLFRDPATGDISNGGSNNGVGSSSGVSIHDANLLKLRITYCTRLIVPFINKIIISTLKSFSDTKDQFEQSCLDAEDDYRLPIAAHSIIRMQSPPKMCPGCYPGSE